MLLAISERCDPDEAPDTIGAIVAPHHPAGSKLEGLAGLVITILLMMFASTFFPLI